jgi:glycogenin glucosyltransferase
MWYKVPETKPKPAEPPKPIFPWEREANRPKPTRVFAEDIPPEPVPIVSSPTHPFSTVHYEDDDRMAPGTAAGVKSPQHVSSPKSADEQWQAFQQSNVNAWDSVPGIETYVRAIVESQGRRGKTQTLQQTTGTDDLGSPLLNRRNRRESLIITDFPSAVERPSLPVTPAPVRRPTFWGEERNEAGELPSATGVPDQTEWVCPQCGFFSVSASDFQRRRESFASTTTAVVTPISSTVHTILPRDSSAITERPTMSSAALPKRTFPAPSKSSPVAEDSTESIPPPSVSAIDPRSGVSPSGVPLASLTSPDLLAPRDAFPAFSKSLDYPSGPQSPNIA